MKCATVMQPTVVLKPELLLLAAFANIREATSVRYTHGDTESQTRRTCHMEKGGSDKHCSPRCPWPRSMSSPQRSTGNLNAVAYTRVLSSQAQPIDSQAAFIPASGTASQHERGAVRRNFSVVGARFPGACSHYRCIKCWDARHGYSNACV